MNKIFTRWTILLFIIMACLIALVGIFRPKLTPKAHIRAWVSPKEVELGNPIRFIDSTQADHVFWEFGNGDFSKDKNGSYVYPQTGRYQIRLKIDDTFEQYFIVTVKDSKRVTDFKPIKIIAPQTAIQNEYISFFADGYSKEWRWEFGETGQMDSYEKNPTYSYKLPGVYQVRLMSEDMLYPVVHQIEILPQYSESDTSDVLSLIAKDIQKHLQNIVDGDSFNENYNYILSKYLCNNPNQMVLTNGSKQSDFYSYCSYLKILSNHNTTILEVIIEPDKASNCVKRLLVKQNSSNITQ